MLHLEIIQERLEREFNMTVITTVPNVSYNAFTRKEPNSPVLVNNPSDLPDPSALDRVEEPYIKATIITKSDYVGNVMSLCIEKRGEIKNQTYLTTQSGLSLFLTCLLLKLFSIFMIDLKLFLKAMPLLIILNWT